MRIELEINGHQSPAHSYFTWAPRECGLVETDGATGTAKLVFRNGDSANGGQLVFAASQSGPFEDELELDVDFGSSLPTVFIGGKFVGSMGFPSLNDDDAAFEVVDSAAGSVVGTQNAMVRIRKNANVLTDAERDRFLEAFANLNDRGTGEFRSFRLTHTSQADEEAHGRAGFLPWHRAYLLDLERELQQEDPSVTLPYWRFDEPAPKLFSQEFIGVSSRSGVVQFDSNNPLAFWATDGVQGVDRSPRFNTSTESALVRSEIDTLNLGNDPVAGAVFSAFRRMEGNPHGSAHISFVRPVSFIGFPDSAPKDPLFFLLHCNVDRLWAKWQWLFDRFDKGDSNSYSPLGAAGSSNLSTRIGHNSLDSLWPWNQSNIDPRPTPTRGSFPSTQFASAPGPTPTVEQMIDFQGKLTPDDYLGFDYADVPFVA